MNPYLADLIGFTIDEVKSNHLWELGFLKDVAERLDGSGYPRGLKGDDILIEARIIAVADTVEAMSSHRPHRPELGLLSALQEVAATKGTRYDASVVDSCMRVLIDKGYSL